MVPRPVSVARPPWFDTITPSAPCSTARAASSPVSIPFSTTFMVVSFFRRSTKLQSASAARVSPLSPANIGFARFRSGVEPPTGGVLWHALQSRVSSRAKRAMVSRLLPARRSTVQTSTGQPAASARLTIFSVSAHVAGM